MGCKNKLQPPTTVFKFGLDREKSQGKLQIRAPVPEGGILLIQADVVPVDILFLIALDILDTFKMVVENVNNVLDCRLSEWKLPIERKLGHNYMTRKRKHSTLFTKAGLVRLHREFHDPSTKKLHELLKRARPEDLDKDTQEMLENIAKHCDTCQDTDRSL